MLKKVLSISGKSGLFKLIAYGKNGLIVESFADKKRFSAQARDKVISLGDIAIYTQDQEVPLWQVFETIYKKYEGKPLDTAELKTGAQLYEFFNQVLPDFDQDRVYTSDIKKVVNWYNALVGAGFTEFKTEEPQEEETDKQ
ncbi:MAG: DUF5606 domain-containing protein [Muribaculaceae bacterium]|jgi:hypothetical protein|nr:DUF5606 domain-containing protein [Muribaculaceae bacterium]HAP50857.1 hypothetical protein [Porphyromonadaceae bacterium]